MAAALVIFICATVLFLILWIRERAKHARKLPPNYPTQQYYQQPTQYQAYQQPLDPYRSTYPSTGGRPYYQQGSPYPQPQSQPPQQQEPQAWQYQTQQQTPQYAQYQSEPGFYPQQPYQQPLDPYAPSQQAQYRPTQEQPYPQAQNPYAPPPYVPKPQRTKEEIHLRNLNIILFVASFLVIAGAAVIIGSMSNSSARLIILLAITAVFYLAGIVIHVVSERLRPAALALTSIGLALIPFTGIAFYYFAALPGPTAWLIMSAIGLVANIIATYILRNQVVTYCAIAFVFSLLCSLVATAAIGIVWNFAVLILISMICSLVSVFKPALIPELILKPIERTGQFVTPAAVICSFFVIEYATSPMYSIVFALAAVHYLIAFIKTKKPLAEILLRIMTQAAVICIVSDIFAIAPSFSYNQPAEHLLILAATILVTSALQMITSLIILKKRDGETSLMEQLPWILCASLVAMVSYVPLYPSGIDDFGMIFVFVIFLFLSLYYGYATILLKKIGFAYASLVFITVAILTLLRLVISPAIPFQIVSVLFLAFAIIILLYYHKQREARRASVCVFLKVAFLFYIIFAIITAEMLRMTTTFHDPNQSREIVFCGIILIASAALLQWLSTLENKLVYMIISCWLLYFGMGNIIYEIASSYFRPVSQAIAGLVIFGAGVLIYHYRSEGLRRNTAFIAATASALILLTTLAPATPALSSMGAWDIVARDAGVITAAFAALLATIAVLSFKNTGEAFKRIAVTCSLSLCFVASIIAVQVGEILAAAMFFYLAAMAYLFVDRLRISWLVLVAIPSVMTALFMVPQDIWTSNIVTTFFIFGVTAAVSYVLYHIGKRFAPDDKFRINALYAFTLFYLLLTTIVPMAMDSPFDYASATALLAIGVILWLRGNGDANESILKEVGLYVGAGAAIWFMTIFANSPYNIIFAAHIAAGFVCLAALIFPKESSGRFVRQAVCAAIITAGTGIQALLSLDAIPANDIASFALFLYLAVLTYLFSIRFRIPWILILSIPSLMGALFFIPWNTAYGTFRPELFVFVNIAVISGFLYMINLRLRSTDTIRTNILYCFSLLYLLLAAIVPGIFGSTYEFVWPEVVSATALFTMGVLLWIRGIIEDKEKILKELGLYAGAAAIIWYATIFISGDFGGIIGAHIAVAAVIVSALLLQNEGRCRMIRLIIALAIVTVGTLAQAISSEMLFFQILFLAEMIAILLIGALRNKQWMIIWGSAGTIAAILYYLRNYTWMMLIFIGILLIAFVIWRLMKTGKKKG